MDTDSLKKPKLLADFNGLFGDLLCLSHGDTSTDESGAEVVLREGMEVIAFDLDADEEGRPDNLIASGVAEVSPEWLQCSGSRFVLRIDENGVRSESEIRDNSAEA
jgi:hypothetical protein